MQNDQITSPPIVRESGGFRLCSAVLSFEEAGICECENGYRLRHDPGNLRRHPIPNSDLQMRLRGEGGYGAGMVSVMPSVLELIPSSKKHVIWDFNGTLVDDVSLVLNITNDILGERGLPRITVENYRSLFEFPVSKYYAKLGLPGEGEAFRAVADIFARNFESGMHNCALRHDALPCIAALAKRKKTSSVLSASRQGSLEALAKQFELAELMTEVCGIDDHYAHGKIESGRRWMAETNRAPHEVVMVGDTAHDFEVATELGVNCILVSYGHSNAEKLAKCNCPIADSLC